MNYTDLLLEEYFDDYFLEEDEEGTPKDKPSFKEKFKSARSTGKKYVTAGDLTGKRRGAAIAGNAAVGAGAATAVGGLAGLKSFKKKAPDLYQQYIDDGGDMDYKSWYKKNSRKYKIMAGAGAAAAAAGTATNIGARKFKTKPKAETATNEGWINMYYDFDDVLEEAYIDGYYAMLDYMDEDYDEFYDSDSEDFQALMEDYFLEASAERVAKKVAKRERQNMGRGSLERIGREKDYDVLDTALSGTRKQDLIARSGAEDLFEKSAKSAQDIRRIKNKADLEILSKSNARKQDLRRSRDAATLDILKRSNKMDSDSASSRDKTNMDIIKRTNKSKDAMREAYAKYVKKCASDGVKPRSYNSFCMKFI